MDFEAIRSYLEKAPEEGEPARIHELPYKFFDPFIVKGLRIDLVEPNRIVCTFKLPARLLNARNNTLQGGAIASLVDLVGSAAVFASGARSTGVSVEINVSYLDFALADEEIEIEAKSLHVGKTVAVVSVDFRKKATGKMIAQGRHTKYLPVSKM